MENTKFSITIRRLYPNDKRKTLEKVKFRGEVIHMEGPLAISDWDGTFQEPVIKMEMKIVGGVEFLDVRS